MRKQLQDKLRQNNPELSAELESQPWYVDPDGPWGGDDWLTVNYEWIDESDIIMCWQSYVHIETAQELKEAACGPVERYTVDEGCIEYSFPIKASYAFRVLQVFGHLPDDAVLMNSPDVPSDYYDLVAAA
jgi:hypothetical protein